MHPNYLFYCFKWVCGVCPNLSSAPCILYEWGRNGRPPGPPVHCIASSELQTKRLRRSASELTLSVASGWLEPRELRTKRLRRLASSSQTSSRQYWVGGRGPPGRSTTSRGSLLYKSWVFLNSKQHQQLGKFWYQSEWMNMPMLHAEVAGVVRRK